MDVPAILVTEPGSRKRSRGHCRTKAVIDIPVFEHDQSTSSNSRSPTRYSGEEGDGGDDQLSARSGSSGASKRRRFYLDDIDNRQDVEYFDSAPPSPLDTCNHLLPVDIANKDTTHTRPQRQRRDREDWEDLR